VVLKKYSEKLVSLSESCRLFHVAAAAQTNERRL